MKIELEQVSARHPAARGGFAPALGAMDLVVAQGEQLAVIGPSGAGKTTLLKVLACALLPMAGTFRLDGREPWGLSRRQLQRLRGRLFLAPQAPPLPPRQRVVTGVLAGRLPAMGLLASLRSLVYPIDIPAAHDALDRFDLAEKLFERADRLSGGELQRVGLARVLLAPARLWLIDEPLSSLDPTRARQALSTLVHTARERGVTLVVTLHDVQAALEHFPRIVGLRDGLRRFDRKPGEISRDDLDRLYEKSQAQLRVEARLLPAAQRPAPDSPATPASTRCR